MIVLGEAVGFVAEILEEFEAHVIAGEADGGGFGLDVKKFFFFGEGDDHGGFDVHGCEDFHGGVKLAEAAVDEDHVGVELVVLPGLAIAARNDLLNREIIVVTQIMFDLVAAIGIFEWHAVNEADLGADSFAALKMGDVDGLDNPRRLGQAEGFLQFRDAFLGMSDEGLGLPELLGAFAGAIAQSVEGFDFVAQLGRALEVDRLGSLFHLLLQIAQNGFAVAVEKLDEATDVVAIRIAGNFVGTGGSALIDGIEKAGAEEFLARIGFEYLQVAGAKFEGPLEVLDSFFELINAGEWAIEFDAFGAGDAGDVDAGIIIVERDHQVGVGLVIDEANIKARLDVLDEAVFREERFDFAIGLERFEIDDVLEQAGFGVLELGAGLEIGTDAVAQGRGLAHINHSAFVILHEVDAGGFGEALGLLVEVLDAFIHDGWCIISWVLYGGL